MFYHSRYKLKQTCQISKMIKCGGTSDAKEMTSEVTEVCHQVRPALEEKLGSPCATFEPKAFRQQVS